LDLFWACHQEGNRPEIGFQEKSLLSIAERPSSRDLTFFGCAAHRPEPGIARSVTALYRVNA